MERESKLVIFRSANIKIPNIYELPKIGAGHDGYVFKYEDKAVKLLKYDIDERRQRDLMTFKKALYFEENLNLKRIASPIDTILDEDGKYTGYVMRYLHDITKPSPNSEIKKIDDFTCGDLFTAIDELQIDVNELSKNKVSMEDLNRYSFIYTDRFLHLCDTDKYKIVTSTPEFYNNTQLRYIIAKFLLYQMTKEELGKMDKKKIEQWCKKSINDTEFFNRLRREIYDSYDSHIGEFVEYKKHEILR